MKQGVRAGQERSRDPGGTGLGLAIVKHVPMRHEAGMEITSEPGQGSTFCCRFPADRVVVTSSPDAPGEADSSPVLHQAGN